jgi:hypothetical protein
MNVQNHDEQPDERQAEARRQQIREALGRLLKLLAEGIAGDLLARDRQEQGRSPAGDQHAE